MVVAKELGGIELFRMAEPQVTVLLSLASTKCRPSINDDDLKSEPQGNYSDLIPVEKCLRPLADLRRAKWYHVSYRVRYLISTSKLTVEFKHFAGPSGRQYYLKYY